MSWTERCIEEWHRKAKKGYEVVGVLEGTISLCQETTVVTYVDGERFTVVDEYVARCILELDNPCKEEIAKLLGFPESKYVEPTLDRLRQLSLIVDNENVLVPHESLRQAWATKSWAVPREKSVLRWLEPFSGNRYPLTFMNEGHSETNELVKWKELLLKLPTFLEWASTTDSGLADIEILEVKSVSYGPWKLLPVQLVICIDIEASDYFFEPYDPLKRSPQPHLMRAVVANGAEHYVSQLAQDKLNPSNTVVPELPVPPLQLKIATTSVSDRFTTTEIRPRLFRQIGAAESEVIFVMPWIKEAARDFLDPLARAVKRGVNIYIGYGIASRKDEEESHDDVIEQLQRVYSKEHRSGIHVIWFGLHHSKEILVDRRHYYNGSFNLLSFRGDPDRVTGKVRAEIMSYMTDPVPIGKFRSDVINKMAVRIARNARSRGIVLELEQWRDNWYPSLFLSSDHETVTSALQCAPKGVENRCRAMKNIIAISEKSLSNETKVDALVTVWRELNVIVASEQQPPQTVAKDVEWIYKRVEKASKTSISSSDPVLALLR